MSNLTLFKQEEKKPIKPSFTEKESNIVSANYSRPVVSFTKKESLLILSEIVLKCLTLLGSKKKSPEEYLAMAVAVLDTVLVEYPTIKIEELRKALNNGCLGKYKKSDDEVLFFSVERVCSWINSYNEEKQKVMSEQLKYIGKKMDKIEQDLEYSISYIDFYRSLPKNLANSQKGDKMSSVYFDFLVDNGLMDLNEHLLADIKEESIKKAKDQMRIEGIIRLNEGDVRSRSRKIAREEAFFTWKEFRDDEEMISVISDECDKYAVEGEKRIKIVVCRLYRMYLQGF